jgi:type I restriction enzyme S subunit
MPMLERPSKLVSYRFDQLADQINDRVMPDEADVDRYVGLEHLDPDSLRIRRWGDTSEVESTKLLFKPGDIIFGKRRVYQRKVAVADFEGICSAHAMVLRAKPETVLPEFLPFFMQSDLFMERALSISVGSLSPTINCKALAKEEFLLPAIQEQARLVEAVLASTALAETLFEARERCEDLFRSVLQDRMASGLKPKAYQGFDGSEQSLRTVALGEIATVERGRFSHRPRNLPQFFGGPYPFAQTGDVGAALGRQFSPSQTLSDEGRQYSRSFPADSILTTIAAVIAATAITTEETWCTDSVVGIVPKRKEDVDFIEYAMRYTRPFLEHEVATQTAQKNINLEILRPLRLPWPERETRSKIVRVRTHKPA